MDERFNFSKYEDYPAVAEIRRLITTFEISYYRAPKDLKVDVYEIMFSKQFHGIINYGYWGPNQAGPYKACIGRNSINDALREALLGIISNDSSEYPNDLIFWVGDSGKIFDGNGEQITVDEVARRRRNCVGTVYKQVGWTDTSISGGPYIIAILNDTTKKAVIIDNCDASKLEEIIDEVIGRFEWGQQVRYLDEKMHMRQKSAFIDHIQRDLNFIIKDYDDYKDIFLED